MKKSLIAAIVLAGASFGTAVQAQVIGDSPQALELVDDAAAYFGDTFGEGNSGSTFADRFTFTIDSTVGINLDAIVGSASRAADAGLDITGLSLYDGNDNLLSQGTAIQSGAVDVWTVAGGNLSSGDYYLRVNGNIVSNDASAFGGAVMLMPVPEPETYGMMLGGLGILGYLARRRQAKRS